MNTKESKVDGDVKSGREIARPDDFDRSTGVRMPNLELGRYSVAILTLSRDFWASEFRLMDHVKSQLIEGKPISLPEGVVVDRSPTQLPVTLLHDVDCSHI